MMPDRSLGEIEKAVRYAWSFLNDRLVHTNLQLLYDCNFRCGICDFWKEPELQPARLSAAQVEVISQKLARVGPQIVSIGGGEPLLHPEIADVVRALARRHFPVMICNGWYVTAERSRELFAAGMYEVSVSVDYADADRHDRQRGVPGAFQRAIDALKVLHENRTSPYQRVHMISVVMDDNLDEVEPLIRLCRELGITYLVTLYSDSRGDKERRAARPDASRRLLELKARYPEFVALRGYVDRFSQAAAERGIGPCYAGRNLCNIDSQGAVSLCIDRKHESVGNILTDDMDALVAALQERQRANRCRSCWTSCRGSIETLMRGAGRLANLRDYCRMVRPVSLAAKPGARPPSRRSRPRAPATTAG